MSDPEVPSPTPVPGWSRGIDGNWWPPAPRRQRPQPMEPPRPPRRRRARSVVGVVGLVVFVLVVLAIVGGIVAVLVDYNGSTPVTSGLTGGTARSIGETARTASFDVTANAAHDPYDAPNASQPPPLGFPYVAVDLTITNVGDRDLIVSALQLIELTDAAGRLQHDATETGGSPIEGFVAAHDTRHGSVVFTVADTAARPFTLRVKGEVQATGVTFSIP